MAPYVAGGYERNQRTGTVFTWHDVPELTVFSRSLCIISRPSKTDTEFHTRQVCRKHWCSIAKSGLFRPSQAKIRFPATGVSVYRQPLRKCLVYAAQDIAVGSISILEYRDVSGLSLNGV